MQREASRWAASAKACSGTGCGGLDAVLLDQQSQLSRLRRLQRQLHLHLVGPDGLPFGLELLACRVAHHDAIDAAHAARLRGEWCPRGRRSPRPSSAASRHDSARALTSWKVGPEKGSKPQYPFRAPRTRLPRLAAADSGRIHHEAALLRVRSRGQLDRLAVAARQAEVQVVRIARGEHQRRALDRQDERALARAVDFLGVDRMQRRRLRRLDGRQRGHEHRLRVVE